MASVVSIAFQPSGVSELQHDAPNASQGKKKFISRSQLTKLSAQLTEVLGGRNLPRLLLDKLLTLTKSEAPNWHVCYEYPPVKLIGTVAYCFGMDRWLESGIGIDELVGITDESIVEVDAEEWDPPHNVAVSQIDAIAVLFALLNDLECQARHGVHMNDLLKKGRLGDDAALFKALEIDPAVMGCAVLVKRLNRARLKTDDNFLHQFSLKINATSKRHEMHRKQMRLILKTLHESGQLAEETNESLHTLFIELNINPPSTDNRDNIKTLKTNLLKSLKNST